MRRYKPDMMTALVVLVVIGVVMTASIQAQEFRSNQLLHITGISKRCIDIPGGDVSCLSSNDIVLGITHEPSYAINKLWQPHRLSQEDDLLTTSFSALENHPCKKSHKSTQSSLNADFSDYKIGLSRYMTVDFEMEDISRFEISSIEFGFKDCW